jgi:hypothetical protein
MCQRHRTRLVMVQSAPGVNLAMGSGQQAANVALRKTNPSRRADVIPYAVQSSCTTTIRTADTVLNITTKIDYMPCGNAIAFPTTLTLTESLTTNWLQNH